MPPAPPFSFMKNTRRILSPKMKALMSLALADEVGYLSLSDFPEPDVFDRLPVHSYIPHKVIRCNSELLLVKSGEVELWHKRYDLFIKRMPEGSLFGDMPLLGQTMLVTQAISGEEGASVARIDAGRARGLIRKYPLLLFELMGPRFSKIQERHFGFRFQLTASRVAGLLLELAGNKDAVEKLSHSDLSKMLGVYRETTTGVLQEMKAEKLIQVQRRRIVILDKPALQELSEL